MCPPNIYGEVVKIYGGGKNNNIIYNDSSSNNMTVFIL